jgi:hypothetical protein
MVPESLDSAHGFYFIGTIVLVLGILAGGAGIWIKRRLEEDQRDERYARERRGEEVAEAEPGRIVDLLQYAGIAAIGLGIVLLVAGWTVAPGKP